MPDWKLVGGISIPFHSRPKACKPSLSCVWSPGAYDGHLLHNITQGTPSDFFSFISLNTNLLAHVKKPKHHVFASSTLYSKMLLAPMMLNYPKVGTSLWSIGVWKYNMVLSLESLINLNHYFNRGVCLSIRSFVRPFVRHKIFFLLKSPWNHPLTPGVDPGCTPGTRPLRRS